MELLPNQARLQNKIKEFCNTIANSNHYLIGLSGGLDSHVLLHLFSKYQKEFPKLKFRAVHIHHGLSPNADSWAEHCKHICKQLEIECIIEKISIPKEVGKSREDIARQHRYQILKQLLQPNEILLTAHHQNDQAETVLLQLLRGCGPKGLSAMPVIKPFGVSFHARPLLEFTREELKAYAKEQKLSWIEDETNIDISFTRNYLRQDLIPIIEKRFPSVISVLARVAHNCAQSEKLLEEYTQQDLVNAKTEEPNTISVSYLKTISKERQLFLLRAWFQQQNVSMPSQKKLHQILRDVLHSAPDKLPIVNWGKMSLRRFRDKLLLHPFPNHPTESLFENVILPWNLKDDLKLPDGSTLTIKETTGNGLKKNLQKVTVRFRQGGESCQLPGRTFHQSLKKLFQQWHVEPWRRGQIPLIYVDDILAFVVGFTVCDGFEAKNDEPGIGIFLRNS